MSTNRIQQILGVETSKESTNRDTYLKVSLDDSQRLLPPDVINKVVDVSERFDVERQRSKYYRILGTINSTISNALFNLDDTVKADEFTWKGFNYQNPNGTYRFSDSIYPTVVNDNLKENDGWFGYYNPDISKRGFCNFFDMEPKRERLSFLIDVNPYNKTTTVPVKNWELTITYPYAIDSGHTMVYDSVNKFSGLIILEANPAIVSTRVMTVFSMTCQHNLVAGDLVRITGTTGYDGDHLVVRTGLDNGDLKEYTFVVDLPPTGTISNLSRMNKIVNGFKSQYYFRKFKKIKTRNTPVIETDDYEIYRAAFSQNIYSDTITQFVFNEDIDVTDLTDNLGRPLSELYLTVIKTNSNGLFSRVSSGIETPFYSKLNTSPTDTFLLNIPVINKIHNGLNNLPWPSHIPLENNVTINNPNNEFYGDLVEYNIAQVKETKLADVSHRFNTLNRETSQATMTYITSDENTNTSPITPAITETISLGPRQEGYFYKPHNQITIRQFSNYVEQGDQNTVGIPEYAVDLGDGRYFWRDLLDIGYNQADTTPLDYPFTNNCHYMYDNYCFYVRRQDPFDNWDLYYGKFPRDPIGERITDRFTTNSANDVC